MTSFSWKRKVGGSVLKEVSKTFEANSKDVEDEIFDPDDIDWLSFAPKRKCLQLEDARAKSERLRMDGVTLAEAERYWEALHKWDEALQLTPSDEKLHEMKAQVLMSLGEVYPAVCAAEKAVSLNTMWWIAHQTLGRAQLGLGEVKLALRSFSRAVHINPANTELREDDLMWAVELVERKEAFHRDALVSSSSAAAAAAATSNYSISTLHADSDCTEADYKTLTMLHTTGCSPLDDAPCVHDMETLPPNYVVIRD